MVVTKTGKKLPFGARWPIVAAILFSWLLVAQFSSAQTAGTGAVTGSVVDSGGGTVAGARIIVTSQNTGEARSTVTDDRGNFLIPTLPPQSYSVEVSKVGFKTLTTRDLRVTVAETVALNLRLEVGEVSERVVVEIEAEILQTEGAALGYVTDQRLVEGLPLVTRNYTQILALSPGVSADVRRRTIGRVNSACASGGPPRRINLRLLPPAQPLPCRFRFTGQLRLRRPLGDFLDDAPRLRRAHPLQRLQRPPADDR